MSRDQFVPRGVIPSNTRAGERNITNPQADSLTPDTVGGNAIENRLERNIPEGAL
ncbi:MAG: hypothetical protein ACKO4V_08695 [Planctomycetota bacterium]